MRKRDQALLAALGFVAGCEMALAAGLIRKLQKYAVKAAAAAFPAEEAPEEGRDETTEEAPEEGRDETAEEAPEEGRDQQEEEAPEDGDGRDAGTV